MMPVSWAFSKAQLKIDEGMTLCNLSNAFDRVWHKGILFELQTYGITTTFLEWFKSYLYNTNHCPEL